MKYDQILISKEHKAALIEGRNNIWAQETFVLLVLAKLQWQDLKKWNIKTGKITLKLALFAETTCSYRQYEIIYQELEQTRKLSNPYVRKIIFRE